MGRGLVFQRSHNFATKKPSPEDGEMVKKRHESEINKKLNSLVRGEILPILLLTCCGVLGYIFWDNILNLMNLKRASDSELRSISRKVATFKKYSHIKDTFDPSRIEVELIEETYTSILSSLNIKALKPEITLYTADKMELTLLPNGSLFLSDTLLHSLTDVRQLIFLILRHLELLLQNSLEVNLRKKVKYGDFRRQYLFFKMKYTGYDALFMDYFVNMRYTLEQVREADYQAIKGMKERMGVRVTGSGEIAFINLYKDLLYKIGKDKEDKTDEIDRNLLEQFENFVLEDKERKEEMKVPDLGKISKAIDKSSENYNKMIQEEKEEREIIEKRDYEIYDQMNYKLSERKYHLSELYPIGSETIEKVSSVTSTPSTFSGTPINIPKLEGIFSDWKTKKRRLRKYNKDCKY